MKGNSRLYYINGLRDLSVQIDMVLTFHFRQGLPRKCLYVSQENHPRLGALRAPNSGWIAKLWVDSRALSKDISWEVLDENER